MRRLTHIPSPLAAAAAAVLAADVAGFIVATTSGLSGVSHAIVSGTSINAPAPFVVVQMTIAALAVAYRGRLGGTIAAGLLVPLCLVSVLSGFADGSFGDSALGAGEIAVQPAIVVATAVLGTLAGRQVATALRGRSLTSVAS
ncbi:MAG TPA: hypothetical protein VFW14_00870 [Gaiellales bacterium]|nr:hypothetical protein [Gaiellales bacterium]